MSNGQYPPSARRLKRARQDGDAAKSAYVAEMIQLFAALGVVSNNFGYAWLDIKLLVQFIFRGSEWPDLIGLSLDLLLDLLFIPLLVSGMVGLALEHLQNILTPPGGIIWISPKLKTVRFSLPSGLQRIRAGLRKIPLLVILTVGLFIIALISFNLIGSSISLPFKNLFLLSFGAYFAISCADVVLARQAFIRRNRMSRQELVNEFKDEEGDPRLKAHLRSTRESMTYHELCRRVKRSKVVVVSR